MCEAWVPYVTTGVIFTGVSVAATVVEEANAAYPAIVAVVAFVVAALVSL